MGRDHAIVIPSFHPTALCDNLTVGKCSSCVEGQHRQATQQHGQSGLTQGRKGGLLIKSPLQLDDTEGRQQNRPIVRLQARQDSLGSVAGVIGSTAVRGVARSLTG